MIQTVTIHENRTRLHYERLEGFKPFSTRWDAEDFGIFFHWGKLEIVVFSGGTENHVYCQNKQEFNAMFEALWIVWNQRKK
jgi:hypothetical protein